MARKIPADAFRYYVGLGAKRSYEAVARRYGISKRAVTKRAAQERWQEQLASLERENEQQLQILREVQAKALRALLAHPLTNAMDAVHALEIGITLERLICGLSSRRIALRVGGAGTSG